jgi:hypothetical protein
MATKKRKIRRRKTTVKRKWQTGSSNRKRDAERSARPPGKRKSRSGNVYTERRRNRTDMPGKLTGTGNHTVIKKGTILNLSLIGYPLPEMLTSSNVKVVAISKAKGEIKVRAVKKESKRGGRFGRLKSKTKNVSIYIPLSFFRGKGYTV